MILNSTQQAALREARALLDDLADVGALGAPDAAAVRAGSAALSALLAAAFGETEVAANATDRALASAIEAERLLNP